MLICDTPGNEKSERGDKAAAWRKREISRFLVLYKNKFTLFRTANCVIKSSPAYVLCINSAEGLMCQCVKMQAV